MVASFIQSKGYAFPVLLDTDSAVTAEYAISGVPMTFFIGRDGTIKYIQRGAFTSLTELQSDLNKID